MDTTLSAWVAIGISLAGLGWSVYRGRHSDDKEWRQHMENKINAATAAAKALAEAEVAVVRKDIDRFANHHNQHFDASRKLEVVAQSLEDHKESDDRQFGEIREMFREIRTHLRDLRNGNGK